MARESRILLGISETFDFISTISAASIATSVPAPIAIPKSALVKAIASLMPSPTIATFPNSCSFLMTSSLPSGRTSAITKSTPASFAIASAVFFRSPVNITVKTPCFLSSLIPSFASVFKLSATEMAPKSSSPLRKNRFVLPSAERAFKFSKNSSFTGKCSRKYPSEQAMIFSPPCLAVIPCPAMA